MNNIKLVERTHYSHNFLLNTLDPACRCRHQGQDVATTHLYMVPPVLTLSCHAALDPCRGGWGLLLLDCTIEVHYSCVTLLPSIQCYVSQNLLINNWCFVGGPRRENMQDGEWSNYTKYENMQDGAGTVHVLYNTSTGGSCGHHKSHGQMSNTERQ